MASVHHIGAPAPGLVTPKSDKARHGVAGLVGVQTEISSRNSEPLQAELQASDELGIREFNELQQRFARLGFGLYPLADNTLLATRWGMSRVLRGHGSARAFLVQVGGAHAV